MIRSFAVTVSTALLTTLLVGCAAHWPEQDPTLKGEEATFKVPPKEALARCKEVVTSPPLSLTIEEEKEGSFLTSPQRFPGEWHILRRWQEQTRYRITVTPDFDDPTTRCMVDVREFTETRAADGMKWAATEPMPRPERAKAVLAELAKGIRTPTTATTKP